MKVYIFLNHDQVLVEKVDLKEVQDIEKDGILLPVKQSPSLEVVRVIDYPTTPFEILGAWRISYGVEGFPAYEDTMNRQAASSLNISIGDILLVPKVNLEFVPPLPEIVEKYGNRELYLTRIKDIRMVIKKVEKEE